jgi:aminopeptidase N
MRAPGVILLLAAAALPLPAQVVAPPAAAPAARSIEHHIYQPGIDVLDYELLLDLPDTGSVIEGRALLSVRRSASVDTLRLDLLRLRVDSVLVNEVAVRFRRDSARIHIPLHAAGDTFRVAVRYGGAVTDGLIIGTDPRGRWVAFGDNWPDRARHWIPSVDHPSDKATVTWIVMAPANRRVVANGVQVEERTLGAVGPRRPPRKLTRWRLDRPIPVHLMVIAAAPLAFHDLGRTACGLAEEGGCVPQAVYVEPEVVDYLPGPFAEAGAMTEYFAQLVGPFPYPRLAHLQATTRFGGMENATAIFYSARAFRQRAITHGLIAHEIAHQWFGNAVTQRDWAHLWLSEGFASYLDPLWFGHAQGDSVFRRHMRQMRQQVLASPATAQRPVVDTAETDYMALLNTNSYQKGAWVLHMLRAQVGDSSFFRGVRSYYQRHRHGTADSDDLRLAVEAEAGEPLDWFFDQWLRRPGHAEITSSWQWNATDRRVTLVIRQGAAFPPYRFPLTVEVHDARGGIHRQRLTVSALPSQRLTIPLLLDAAPARIVLDPDVELLARFRER